MTEFQFQLQKYSSFELMARSFIERLDILVILSAGGLSVPGGITRPGGSAASALT